MKRDMNSKGNVIYTLIAPIMVLITIIGYTFRSERKKSFYFPLGTVGIYLILNKEFNRRFNRNNILKKIQCLKNNK